MKRQLSVDTCIIRTECVRTSNLRRHPGVHMEFGCQLGPMLSEERRYVFREEPDDSVKATYED